MAIIISTIMGAGIGYITNWVAIKMLFRPYEEKRIFGIKVPFTPGLIPKEQFRIAKSVGEAIENHLLTKETLIESLCSDDMISNLEKWIGESCKSLCKSEMTIKEYVKKITKDNYDLIEENVEDKLYKCICTTLDDEKNLAKIHEYLHENLKNILNDIYKKFKESASYDEVKITIEKNMKNYVNSDEFNNNIEGFIYSKIIKCQYENLKLNEILPKEFLEEIKYIIVQKKNGISKFIIETIKSEDVEIKIKSIIKNIISGNVNPLVSMMLNTDLIYNKIINAILNSLEEEETKDKIVETLNLLLDNISDMHVNEIFNDISEEQKLKLCRNISQGLKKNFLSEENLNKILNIAEFKISNKIDLLLKDDKFIEDKVEFYVLNEVDILIKSQDLKNIVFKLIKNKLNQIMDLNLNKILVEKEEILNTYVINFSKDIYIKFIENKAPSVIETLNISKLIEDKIVSFDMNFAEKIILEIASKELKAITWFGALLGGIIGIITPLISQIKF